MKFKKRSFCYIFGGWAWDFNPGFAKQCAGAEDKGNVKYRMDRISNNFSEGSNFSVI